MKKTYILLVTVLFSYSVNAGNEDYPIGARSAGMGNATVSATDMWSSHHNQAGLGFVREISAGVSYENRFLIKEISVRGGTVALPIKAGTFGLCITNFGYSQYSENKYSLSFAKAFGDKLSAGIAMDYLSTKIAEGYGTRGTLAAEAGIIAKPIKALTIGAHVYNPTRAKLSAYDDERLPTIIRLGADYLFSDKVRLAVEAQKDIRYKAEFKAGLEYLPVKELYLRIGVSTNPTLSSFGFGINLKNFRIDVAANYHQTLGISPQLSLSYTFANSEKKSTTN
ncbi:MAG: hypothetical protein K0S44_1118 [Bacteroidetes bacterium]|jgi:hypothetical protein|nr:hypothetical protein [Bacteroidota bacterium]